MEQEQRSLRIYPHRDKAFELELKRLETANISQRNKELITAFQNYIFSTGTTGKQRITKLSGQLRRICAKLDTDLDKLDKQKLTDLIAIYNKDDRYSGATKSDYRRVIKQFYKWFEEEDPRLQSEDKTVKLETERFYKYIKKEVKRAEKIKIVDFSNIITDEEAQLVVDKGCKTMKEKAFISLLHETGARAGEFLNILIGDIEQKENYAMVRVDGKTGERRVPIVKSIPYLLAYLEIHPFKDNKQSYLWLGESRRYMNKPLEHKGGQKLIDRCFEGIGVNKKHNFHWFRHSRATLLAPKMTEAMLCKYIGWVLGSNQVRRTAIYVLTN